MNSRQRRKSKRRQGDAQCGVRGGLLSMAAGGETCTDPKCPLVHYQHNHGPGGCFRPPGHKGKHRVRGSDGHTFGWDEDGWELI